MASDGPFVVALDPTLTSELAREGLARELVSRIQRLRKEAGYDVSTRIALAITGDDPVREAATTWREWIAGETLARELVIGSVNWEPDRIEPIAIDNLEMRRRSGS